MADVTVWKRVGRVLRMTAGVLLIILGLLGIVVPVMPGAVFVAWGLVMVAPHSRLARWVMGRMRWVRAWAARRWGAPDRARIAADG